MENAPFFVLCHGKNTHPAIAGGSDLALKKNGCL